MPALVLRYDDVLDDPAAAVLQIRAFLVVRGLLDDSRPYDVEAIEEFLRPDLRHTHRTRADLDSRRPGVTRPASRLRLLRRDGR